MSNRVWSGSKEPVKQSNYRRRKTDQSTVFIHTIHQVVDSEKKWFCTHHINSDVSNILVTDYPHEIKAETKNHLCTHEPFSIARKKPAVWACISNTTLKPQQNRRSLMDQRNQPHTSVYRKWEKYSSVCLSPSAILFYYIYGVKCPVLYVVQRFHFKVNTTLCKYLPNVYKGK